MVIIGSSSLAIQQSIGMFTVAYGQTSYDNGYRDGCEEASSGVTASKTGGELEGYSEEFVRGYYDGFTICASQEPAEQTYLVYNTSKPTSW